MKLQYLGTAAAEAIPAVFCECPACALARKTGGRELRSRAGSIIDKRLKIDFGPDSYMQSLLYGIDYSKITSLLITHSHGDHLFMDDIHHRIGHNAYFPVSEPLMTVYGNGAVGEAMQPHLGDRLAFKQLKVFETVDIEGYAVTPLEAVHTINHEGDKFPVVFVDGKTFMRNEEAFFYMIEKDGKRLIYAHDTDEFTQADMEFLKNKRADFISLDCTNGKRQADYIGHMGSLDNLRQRDNLIKNGTADATTRFAANHFSHNVYVRTEELEELMPGFIIAYDGLEVEI